MTVPRDSVAADRTWDAASVFPTVEAWETELEAVLADLPGLAAFSGRLGESAAVLVEALAGTRRDHIPLGTGLRLRAARLRRRDDRRGRGSALRPCPGG